MAGNPTFDVIDTYRTFLQTLMPIAPQLAAGQVSTVPVFYAHPGDRYVGNALVWFDDIEDVNEVHSMRANVRRRVVTVDFKIIIGVMLTGGSFDGALQRQADEFVNSIRKIIDLDIADDEHLHRADVVDWAVLRGTGTVRRGTTADGVGTQLAMRVAFQSRYID